MTKILTTVAVLATIASPAFAATAHKNLKAVRGSDSYAMAPSSVSKYSPALTGGGSIGYNQSEAQTLLNR